MPKINFLKSLILLIGLSLTISLHAVEYTPFQKVILDYEGNAYITDITRSKVVKIAALSGTSTVIAGNGQVGFSGDGGLATEAQLYVPASIAFDLHGNLYIADAGNSRIRKVDAATGIISTVAGNGQFGFNGDHQYALDTQLNMPYDLLIDGQNNLYIADSNNHRIRKFNLDSGIITTVAGNGNAGFSGDGGLATEASLNWPDGISLDALGNLYISDALNHRIRKVDAATGLIYSLDQEEAEQASSETTNRLSLGSDHHVQTHPILGQNSDTERYSLPHFPAENEYKRAFYTSNSLSSRTLKRGNGDSAPPTGNVQINHGSEITNSRSILLNLTCRDNSSGCAAVRISSDDEHWSDWLPHRGSLLWQLEDQEGEQMIYVQFKDRVGTHSVSSEARITLDRLPPAPPVLQHPVDGWLIGTGKTQIDGSAEPHSTVEILLDGTPLALVSSAVDGHWSLAAEFSDGQLHRVTAVVIDLAGNLSSDAMQ